jgi:hypothetical protein
MVSIIKNIQWEKIGKNLLIFTAPALVVFFGQLALKVDWKAAGLVALLTLYGALADFFKKYSTSKTELGQ